MRASLQTYLQQISLSLRRKASAFFKPCNLTGFNRCDVLFLDGHSLLIPRIGVEGDYRLYIYESYESIDISAILDENHRYKHQWH
jgi:prepilin-type processing-associated H-X9-DG protein